MPPRNSSALASASVLSKSWPRRRPAWCAAAASRPWQLEGLAECHSKRAY